MQSPLRLLVLVTLALLPLLARAQDGPPPDLLSHVKVGQRWVFTTTMGDMTVEETLHVAEVHPDRVVYLRSNRTLQGGQTLVETVAEATEEWTWGARTKLEPAGLAMTKSRQEPRTLAVPGLPGGSLACLALIREGLEGWTAVKGDFEVFPGVVKAVADGLTARTLMKVEQGPPPTLPEARPTEQVDETSGLPPGALAHVKVGQRWVFEARTGEAYAADIIWTVTEVDAENGRVVYTIRTTTRAGGQTIASDDEESSEWSGGGSPVLDPGTRVTGVTGERAPLEVPGMKLDCYVVRVAMGEARSETWTAVKGDREVFPGQARVVGYGQSLQLVRVEGR